MRQHSTAVYRLLQVRYWRHNAYENVPFVFLLSRVTDSIWFHQKTKVTPSQYTHTHTHTRGCYTHHSLKQMWYFMIPWVMNLTNIGGKTKPRESSTSSSHVSASGGLSRTMTGLLLSILHCPLCVQSKRAPDYWEENLFYGPPSSGISDAALGRTLVKFSNLENRYQNHLLETRNLAVSLTEGAWPGLQWKAPLGLSMGECLGIPVSTSVRDESAHHTGS